MPEFKVIGIGKETNRKRTKLYKAKDEDVAKQIAENDGTSVTSIEIIVPEPATDRQKDYANKLGLSFPDDININEMSHLISKAVDDDRDSPTWLLNYMLDIFPEENGLSITKYIGIENLFSRLINKYSNEKNNKGLISILLYSILNEERNLNWGTPFNELADKNIVENISDELQNNQKVLNSIKRYTAIDYVTLGEVINDEGFESLGNIKRTNAYLISKASLQEKELINNRTFDKVKQNNLNKSKIKSKEKSGCLGSLILMVVFILMFITLVP